MIYVIIIILLLIYVRKYDLAGTNSLSRAKFVTVILVLLAGLRYRIGTDSVGYEEWFNQYLPKIGELNFNTIFDDFHYEPLFVIYSSFIKTIFNDWIFFQLVTSAITNIVILRFIYKNSNYFFTTTLLYFLFQYYSYNCEAIRATFAICTFLLALPFLKQKKWKSYYGFIIIAIFFHYSSAILLVLPFVKRIKADSKIAIIIYAILFFAGATVRTLYTTFSSALVVATDGFSGAMRMDRYQDGFYLSNNINVNTLILSLFSIIALIVAIRLLKKKSVVSIPYEPLVFVFLCFEVLRINVGIFYRFSIFFTIIIFLTYSLIICDFLKKKQSILAMACIVCVLMIKSYQQFTMEIANGIKQTDVYIPYNSVLLPDNNIRREFIYKKLY